MTGKPEKDEPKDRGESPDREWSFLRRWARRKGQSQAEGQQDGALGPGDEVAASEPAAEAPPPPDDADMPAIESLGEDSDYRGFLSPRVSKSLQRAALRKLFQSPQFDVRDGLDDYDGDYTRYTPLGNTITAHAKYHAERLRAAADDALRTAQRDTQQKPDRDTEDESIRHSGETQSVRADGEGRRDEQT